MAVILPKGKFKGISGPIYFRTLNGNEIFQTRPNRSKQKKENNTYAILFKKTSYSLKIIRRNIEDFIGNRHDSKLHQRLMGQVMTVLRKNTTQPIVETTIFNTSLIDLVGFELNTNSLFVNSFSGEIKAEQVSDTIVRISIEPFVPALAILFPLGCTSATIRLQMYQMNNDDTIINNMYAIKSIEFHSSDEALIDFTWDVEHLTANVFTIGVVELQFFYPINNNPKQLTLYNSKAFNPSKLLYLSNM